MKGIESQLCSNIPSGIAVSKEGRKYCNYPPALSPEDMAYTVAELTSNTTETPYPNAQINSPPGGRINRTTDPPTGANYQDYFIGVQSVVVDPADRLWILDTGRAATPDGTMVPAAYGGPKLVGIDLKNDSIFQNIIFSPSAAPSTSVRSTLAFLSSIALITTILTLLSILTTSASISPLV